MRDYRLLDAVAFKLRGLALAPLVALLGLCRWNELEHPGGVWGGGRPIFRAGVGLRVWAQRHLCYRLKTAPRLAVTGPYAHVRNPVYIGNLLLLAGLAVACELLWAVPLVLAWGGLVYALAVRFEESRLLKRYGAEYERFRARVPRWLPRARTSAWSWPGCAQAVSWACAGQAEWHCPLFLLLPIVKELVGHGPA